MHRTWRRRVTVLILVAAVLGSAPPTAAAPVPRDRELSALGWVWPLASLRLVAPYVEPAHRYGSGHRGIDLLPIDDADVRAPADGTVAFSGVVAGRGVVTIDHGDGLVTTLEPVASALVAGAAIERGAVVGTISAGGHAREGALHFGVRRDGEYVNPMLLLGVVPRAVLLPCC